MRHCARPYSVDRACLAGSWWDGCSTDFSGHVSRLQSTSLPRCGIFLLARASSFSAGCLAAALIGVGAGGEAAITPYLLTRYFGLRAFSTLYGLTWTFYAAAGAIGPMMLGHAFDATGSYAFLLVILAAVLGLTAAMNLLLPSYSDSFATQHIE
jgi:cyanate permease